MKRLQENVEHVVSDVRYFNGDCEALAELHGLDMQKYYDLGSEGLLVFWRDVIAKENDLDYLEGFRSRFAPYNGPSNFIKALIQIVNDRIEELSEANEKAVMCANT